MQPSFDGEKCAWLLCSYMEASFSDTYSNLHITLWNAASVSRICGFLIFQLFQTARNLQNLNTSD